MLFLHFYIILLYTSKWFVNSIKLLNINFIRSEKNMRLDTATAVIVTSLCVTAPGTLLFDPSIIITDVARI